MPASPAVRDTKPAVPATPPPTKPSFRPDIEGLRAVAVVAVVLGHAGFPLVGGGYIGVDVFFVISGFLITSLLLHERTARGRVSIKSFYARRATRLLPASATVVVATVAAAWLWLPATRFTSIAGDALAGAVYGINLRLAYNGTDYLTAETAPSPLQHLWSLAVEEQFYIVWPLLLVVATVAWRRFGRTPLALTLVGAIAVSLTLSVVHTATLAPWAYFGTHTRAWELAAGALIAVFAAELARMDSRLAAFLTWAGLAAITVSVLWYSASTAFPGYAAVLPVVGAAAVVAGGCAQPLQGAGLLLNRRPFQFLGKVSYGFYLWHWPILLIAPTALDVQPSLLLNLVLCAMALAVSVACLHLIENPIRYRASLKRFPWRGITVGASLTAATAGFTVFTLLFPPATSGDRLAIDTRAEMAASDTKSRTLTDLLTVASAVQSVPNNLIPGLEDAHGDRPAIYRDGCHTDIETVTVQSECTYGDPDGDKTVVLMGDSHAAQWFPALNVIAEQEGWRLLPRTKSACSAPSVTVHNSILNREYRECVEWRDAVLADVEHMRADMVILSSSDADNNQPLGTDDPVREWAEGWVETAERVDASGAVTVNILDTPWAKADVPDCLALNMNDADECGRPLEDAIRQPDRRSLSVKLLEPVVDTFIDPTPWFCVTECPVIVGNLLMYRDSHHMTTDYSILLAPLLHERLPSV
ncbi:MAG TPA: acyltransferase [Candidatus Stackebrandtia excrementipullorum]|nr:acyltransferase [Candidatus Stackebrandtia excrementipullorum]